MNYGTYLYFLNGKPTGITEKFNVETLSDGSAVTTSERNTSIYGTMLYANAEQFGEKFKHFEIQITNENNAEVADVHAIYKFSENTLYFTRTRNGKTVNDEIIKLPENCVIFPLMRVFQGQTILQVARNQAVTTVLVPDIQNPNDAENLLCPTFDERTAQNLGKEAIAFYEPESISIEANLYQYLSEHYDEQSKFWIDDNGLLVAYRFAQSADKIWEIRLEFTL